MSPSNLTSQHQQHGPPAFTRRNRIATTCHHHNEILFFLHYLDAQLRTKNVFLYLWIALRILTHLSEKVYFQKRSISNQNQVFSCHHHHHGGVTWKYRVPDWLLPLQTARVARLFRADPISAIRVNLGKAREQPASNLKIAGKVAPSEAGLRIAIRVPGGATTQHTTVTMNDLLKLWLLPETSQ